MRSLLPATTPTPNGFRLRLGSVSVLVLLLGTVSVPVAASASAATPAATHAAARGEKGNTGPLTPRLQKLADPEFAAKSHAAKSKDLMVATAGPGSLMERPGGRTVVDVQVSDTSASTLARLRAIGAQVVFTDSAHRIVTVEVAPSRLSALAAVQPQVLSAEEVLQPAVNVTCPTGIASEGDSLLKASLGRTNHAVDGTGITVGVLSDSYDNRKGGAATDVTNGELPGTTNTCGHTHPLRLADEGSGGSDEGRAMSQIVHDLAPGADLTFASAFNGEQRFADNIRGLAAAGAKVIVDDVTYFDEPMYQDGVVGAAVEEVSAQGVSYFSSAGNENARINGHDVGSYEAQSYRPTSCPAAVIAADPGVLDCHNFNPVAGGPADNTYGFTDNGRLQYVLGWNEPQFGISTDLDMCILNSDGSVAGCDTANNFATGKAYANVGWSNRPGNFTVVIPRYSGAATPKFKLISFSNLTAVEYETGSGGDVVGPSTFGHNASRSGATVGATPYNNNSSMEAFSSAGPATYCWAPVAGSAPAPPLSPCQSATIDLSATDGTANSFFGQQFGGVWRFYGTSAAAPHAAAVAALIRQERPCLSPAEVLDAMKSTAVNPGIETNRIGAGRVDADAALTAAAGTTVCDAIQETAPGAPTGVTATTGNAQASVSWTAPAGTAPVTGYTVTASPGGKTATTTGATTATVTGLTNGTSYAFTVTATNAAGTSTPSAPSTAVTPLGTLTAAPTPTVSGTAKVGSTLTANPGTWAPATVTLKYQWYRVSSTGTATALSGATASKYVATAADRGYRMRVRVTGSKSGYTSVAKTSALTAAVATGTLSATPTPTVSGTAKVGSTLTANPGTWAPATVTLKYQWYRVSSTGTATALSGATASKYVATAADRGYRMRVRVTGSKSGYTSVAKTSALTAAVATGTLSATPTPTVSGTAKVGSTLTANPGTWAPATVTLKYQWYRVSSTGTATALSGATASKYVATAADRGYRMRVRVTGSKSGYTSVAKTSALTAAVAR